MNATKKIMLVAIGAILCATVQDARAVTNFSHDMSTKTGWTAVQGGESGYVAAPDFVHGNPSHSSVTSATSERHASLNSNIELESLDNFTLAFRVMLHNTIAGVNEPVARVGLLESGGVPVAGEIINAFVTLRRAGSIELQVLASDGIGGNNQIVNASASMPNSDVNGLSGYEFANFTVTRDSSGTWELDVINGYGNNVMNFSATESTVATSSNLSKAWIQDLSGQWDGNSETAVYWDSISVTSVPIPEPASMTLIGLGGIGLLRMRRRKV